MRGLHLGLFFTPEVDYQSEDEKLPNYRNPEAPPITGNFPAPWQSLSEYERKHRSPIKSEEPRWGAW
jgi:hypothetical protein